MAKIKKKQPMQDGQEVQQPQEQPQAAEPEQSGTGLATKNPAAQSAMLEATAAQMGRAGAGTEGGATAGGTREMLSGTNGVTIEAVGDDQVKEAMQTLNEYKQGKTSLDQRIVDNEQWYRLRHWDTLRKSSSQVAPVSGWLFNALANKHADSMDNYPTCTVQPREVGDQEEAKRLSSIIPVVLDQCDFEAVYDAEQDYKLKFGAGVYGVFWDASKLNGLGDISIKQIDILNLFWEPGITDLQESRNLFYVTLVDNDVLKELYPDVGDQVGDKSFTAAEYTYDDNVDTKNKSAVVDWYYKRRVGTQTILHYCKFTGGKVLYASANDPAYAQRGWYDHGMYPFVMDPMFKVAGSPCGFGYIDVAKSAQEYIDRGNQAIMQNMLANARPRHFIRTDGSVNEKEYADLTKDFVHVDGNLGEDSIRPIQGKVLNGVYVTVMNNKIDELKEVTGNRDISTGGTVSGVTAASAIAAMQEAGSKLSRDSNKASHRVFRQVCLMIIELIRQFYDLPRQFRIVGEQGQAEFVSYSNAGLQPQAQGVDFGVDMGYRLPVFDIAVASEKASPYSRLSQNEMAMSFYSAGFFNPQLADQALACLEMMDFDRKDQVVQRIQQNAMAYQAQQMAMMGMGMGAAPAQEAPGGNEAESAGGESSITKNARERVATSTSPG